MPTTRFLEACKPCPAVNIAWREWNLCGPVMKATSKELEEKWGKLAEVMEQNDTAGPWLTGNSPVWADIFVLSYIAWTFKSVSEDQYVDCSVS